MDIEKIKALAESDDTSAQNYLGIAYMTGAGVEQNEQKGVYWFHRASIQGSSEAMANLGMCVLLGRGVEKDVGAALYILESAFCVVRLILLLTFWTRFRTKIVTSKKSFFCESEEFAS